MKHSLRISLIILALFFVTQLIGLAVLHEYKPVVVERQVNETIVNVTSYNLPYGFEPPSDTTPTSSLISFIIALVLAVLLILALMKYRTAFILRFWFLFVIIIALAVTSYAFLPVSAERSTLALLIGIGFGIWKTFRPNKYIHNLTELFIYPGIAAILVPLLSVWTTVILLICISLYDMYAVWHAGFMQKMAKYQMNEVRVFSGLLIPYVSAKEKALIERAKGNLKKLKKLRIKIAILGGGDIIFPLIFAGTLFFTSGLVDALCISIGATLALALLLFYSEKGKFYPAMPFITVGCLLGWGISYLL